MALQPLRVLARLDGHHREIEAVLQDGRRLLGADDACQLKALALVRWQLIRRLRAYQLFKHGEVFDPLIAAGPPLRRTRATELKRRCVAMGAQYGDHVRRWGLGAAVQDWPAYLRDAQAMTRRIRRHLAEEAAAIHLLLRALPALGGQAGPAVWPSARPAAPGGSWCHPIALPMAGRGADGPRMP